MDEKKKLFDFAIGIILSILSMCTLSILNSKRYA